MGDIICLPAITKFFFVDLPIGQLSEEAQKARNKDLKNFQKASPEKSRERERGD
jgi:hypothetical protein